jgi:hypothetical protein
MSPSPRAVSPSPRAASPRPLSPRLLQPTAASLAGSAKKAAPGPLKADAPLYSSFEGTTTGNENSRAAAARAAELRSELRKQRIRERSEEASTAEADFQDPRDQWGNYVQRCGKWSPTGRVRKPSPDKLRLAHNTRERIFSEQSANAEATMAEMAGGGLGPVLDYTAALEAADAEKAAAATPLLAQTSPGRKPRPPTLDAFGRWVGEHVEAQFAGAAGTASRDMWKIKGENKLEFNRINFMTKSQTAAAEMVQFGYPEEDPMAAVKAAEEATTAAAAMRVAGVPSKSLYRKQRERDGLMDETGKPALKEVPHPDRQQKITGGEAAPFAWPAPGEARAVVEEPTPEPVYRSSTPKGRRPVAGLTSKEVVEAYMPWAPKQGVMVRGEQGKLAGVSSAELAAVTVESRLEAPAVIKQDRTQEGGEVKVALSDPEGKKLVGEGATATPKALDVASNAPEACFIGAAGMNSAMIRKSKMLVGHPVKHVDHDLLMGAKGLLPEPHPNMAASVSSKQQPSQPPPPPAVDVSDAQPMLSSTSAPKSPAPVPPLGGAFRAAGIGADSDRPEQPQPTAEQMRPPSPVKGGFGRAASPRAGSPRRSAVDGRYAGARSSEMQRPTNAWEVRHLWSEQAVAPKGDFGAAHVMHKEGGASGMTSKQLAASQKELKFETTYRPTDAEHRACSSPGRLNGAAGLTSSKITEIGVGIVNKFDEPANDAAAKGQAQAAAKKLEGASGMTSHAIAVAKIKEQGVAEEPKAHLSVLAAHAAQARALGSPKGPSLKLEGTKEFGGAAGISSETMGKAAANREFISDESIYQVAARAASPDRRNSRGQGNNSSEGVYAVFGGSEVPSRVMTPTQAGVDFSHGMSSRALAIRKLVGMSFEKPKRSASEPRRRPTSGGDDAGSLLYGNVFGGGRESHFQHKPAGGESPGPLRPKESPAAGARVEERRSSRMARPDNLWSSGGLGGFMGGGMEAVRRRDSMPSSRDRGAIEGSSAKGWSPGRGSNMRASSDNVRLSLGGMGESRMVTSASAIGAGWSPHQSVAQAQASFQPPPSPVRGLRA